MLLGDFARPRFGRPTFEFFASTSTTDTTSVMFLVMDSPELPIKELEEAFSHPTSATLCPSHDDGYGMLCVPHNAPDAIFSNVLCSDPLTAALCHL
jgi:glycosyltransferase A (GT-A) superfamily protein (DUF2064 family)